MNEENKNNEQINTDDTFSGQYGMGLKTLVKTMQAAFLILAMIIVGMLIYFFTFGGYFEVKPQEWVLVARFGRILPGAAAEGWHWVFPYPVNTVIKIPKSMQTIESVSFLPAPELNKMQGPGGPMGRNLAPGKDGYVITGDENIMHTQWILNYNIINPEKYYLKCMTPLNPQDPDAIQKNVATGELLGTRGPRTLLKHVLDNVVLKVASTQKVDTLFRNDKAFKDEVQREFIKEILNLDIGIDIESVLLKSFAPTKTKAAFDEVVEAEQELFAMKEKANKWKVEELNAAASNAATMVAEAQAYKTRVVSEVKADETYFKQILTQYKASPGTVLVTLFNNKLAESLATVKEKYIINSAGKGKKQEIRLKINPEPVNVKKKSQE
jgi:membrane protease subunit HflK